MGEVHILCGDVPAQRAWGGVTLNLDLAAQRGDPAKVNLEVAQITKQMVAALPDRLADLLEIASYVYCADQFTRRDTVQMPSMGEHWSRSFVFKIAVRCPEFWARPGVSGCLVETLSFLSGDQYQFEFVATRRDRADQAYLDLSGIGPTAGFRPAEVLLFSGGLDSLAGAIQTLVERKATDVLVSHHASHLVRSIQTRLVSELRERVGLNQILHVSVIVNKGSQEAVDFSQRARAFLFASLGFVVANFFDVKSVKFFENGVVSINLPLAQHVLGTRATRTTHPQTLHRFGALFSLVSDQDIRIENPFFWMTKTEVIRKIADMGCGQLIQRSFSCTRVRSTAQPGRQHCGICSQCIDRRFGVLAADCARYEESTLYRVDLFRGERKRGPDMVMAEAYVLAAHRYWKSTQAGFLSQHAELFRVLPYLDLSPGEAVGRLHHLHVRHGAAIIEVVRRQLESEDPIAARLELPDSCLLAMIQSSSGLPIPAERSGQEQSASMIAAAQTFGIVPRPIGFAVDSDGKRVVFRGGPILYGASAQLIAKLMPDYHLGLQAVRGEGGFNFVRAAHLAKRIGISEQTLRHRIVHVRRSLKAQFEQHFNAILADDDVVQNQISHGYRLCPHLVLMPDLLGLEPAPDDDGTTLNRAAHPRKKKK